MINILSNNSSIISQYLRELRDVDIQQDRRKFENNLERLALIAGYELSKQLQYASHQTTTPLAKINTPLLQDQIVIATILRAGLPVQNGLHQVFDDAELAFVAAGRKPETANGVEIDLAYVATPELEGKVLIIGDTMLATGHSLIDCYKALVAKGGVPSKAYIVAVIASQPGIDYVQMHLPEADITVAAIDPKLNDSFFIVPGLGDAGDLLYGPKL